MMENDQNGIVKKVRNELIAISDEKARISGERYFREAVSLYGVKSADVIKISRKYFNMLADKSKESVFLLCEEFWRSGYLEEAAVACDWSLKMNRQFEPDDLTLFERWIIRYVSNWAACDALCNHTVGTAIEMYPDEIYRLINWTNHPLRWMRRASAVSLIIPARKGLFLSEIFQIAVNLLTDKDDMVRKGYGWMLKAASQAHQKEVFEFVMKNKDIMPRTSLRYSIEKMPEELKVAAMSK
jgi:3-methyladenine DNA glycosylase AlkD